MITSVAHEPATEDSGAHARSEEDLIRSLQVTLSASRLSTFLSCRLKFHFKYVLRLRKPKSSALHIGSTIHSVLRIWNKARWRNQPLTLKQLHTAYDQLWNAEEDEPVEWEAEEEEQQKAVGWRLLET